MKNIEENLKLKAEENYNLFLEHKRNLINYYFNNIGLKINVPLCMIGKLTTKTGLGIIKSVDTESGIVILEVQNDILEISYSVLTDIIEENGFYDLNY